MNTEAPVAVRYAGFWIRLLAYLIDVGIVYGGVVIVLILVEADTSTLNIWWLAAIHGFYTLYACILWMVYDVAFWASPWQATPGKKLLGLRVADLQYGRVTVLRAAWRYLCTFVSALLFGVGFLVIAFSKRKQGLHDMLADTVVIHDRSGEYPKQASE